MNGPVKLAIGLVVGCGLLAVVATAGTVVTNRTKPVTSVGSVSSTSGAAKGGNMSSGPPLPAEAVPSDRSSTGPSATPALDAQRMIVATASMDLRVDGLDKTVEAIRSIVAASGGTIDELVYSQGAGAGAGPIPLKAAGSSANRQPSSAQLTLRIPATQLPEIQKRIAAMGDVLSQSATESDVTQQHLDLAARIANLQAEEARLRAMLGKAKNVSEMLAVERELARVQGDIESMQAQLTYLERQAAQATLSLSLQEPGALVRPGSGGWGLGSAVTSGVQAAAAITRTMVAGSIAVSPLAIAGLLAWAVVRLIRRRAAGGRPTSPEPA